jgi:hypothetical protein
MSWRRSAEAVSVSEDSMKIQLKTEESNLLESVLNKIQIDNQKL